jgi:hypothetical protein
VRPSEKAWGGGASYGWSRARYRRGAYHWLTRLVPRGRRTAFGFRASLSQTGKEPIGCGGVTVFPNDIVVLDDDGATLIPALLLDEVLAAAPEQERFEAWVVQEVENGASLPGPLSPRRGDQGALRVDQRPMSDAVTSAGSYPLRLLDPFCGSLIRKVQPG